MPPFSGESLKRSVNQTKQKVSTKISSEHQKSVISVEKKELSSMTVPLNGTILILLTRGTGKLQKKLKTFQYGED